MSLTNQSEDDILDLLMTNVAAPNWGDAAGLQPSAAAGSIFVSLHTGNAVSDTSTDQTDNEAAYTGYGRVGVARSVAGWTIASGNADNDAAITFGTSSTGPETITDVGLGFSSTLAGYLHMFGSLVSDLIVNNGVTPEFAIGALDITLD